jgi:signal transduction histidine kinase
VAKGILDGQPAVELRVVDTGKGITPEQLATIWEPYVTTTVGGTGLGLAIARQTVLAHGGAVSATSEARRGTEIRFLLPVSGSPAKQNPEGGAQ